MTRSLMVFVAVLVAGCGTMGGAGFNPTMAPEPALDVRLERADTAYREARLVEAERLYRQIAEEHPRLTEVWVRLGNIYTRQNQLDAAVRAYGNALQGDRREGRAWYNLSIAYLKMAMGTLEHASQALPQDSPYRGLIDAQYQSLISRLEVSADDPVRVSEARRTVATPHGGRVRMPVSSSERSSSGRACPSLHAGTTVADGPFLGADCGSPAGSSDEAVQHFPLSPVSPLVSTSIPQAPAPVPAIHRHSVSPPQPSVAMTRERSSPPQSDPPCWMTHWGCTD